jgi:hypothetical protein
MILARAAVALLALGGLVVWMIGHQPVESKPASGIEGIIEREPIAIIAPAGGEVADVLVRPGQRVTAGQELIRFVKSSSSGADVERARAALRRLPPRLFATAGSILSRVRPQVWAELASIDPPLQDAERAYVDALAAAQAQPSPAAQERLRRAAERRTRAHEQRAILGPAALESIGKALRDGSRVLATLDKLDSAQAPRAPEAAIVEIADVRSRDVLPPFGRVALLASAARWMVRAYPVDGAPASWRPGTPVHVVFAGGERVDGTVQSTGTAVTVTVTTPRVPFEPGTSVWILP